MEIGVYTFAETTPDPRTGQTISAAQRLRDLIEEIELADQVGLDVFGVGEHHRPIDKILHEHELFGNQRFLIQFSVGTMPHAKILRSIELLGTEVAPVVRRETAPSRTAPEKAPPAMSGRSGDGA